MRKTGIMVLIVTMLLTTFPLDTIFASHDPEVYEDQVAYTSELDEVTEPLLDDLADVDLGEEMTTATVEAEGGAPARLPEALPTETPEQTNPSEVEEVEEDEGDLINEFGSTMPVPFNATLVQVETWDELRAAVQDAAGDSVFIQLMDDITATGNAIVIPTGTTVYLGSALFGENAFSIYQHQTSSNIINRRHFNVNGGTLSLGNVQLTRDLPANDTRYSGGVHVSNGGSLYLFTGSVISNNRGELGGAVRIEDQGTTVVMHNGEVRHNFASDHSSGIFILDAAEFIMHDGRIHNNRTNGAGAGVNVNRRNSTNNVGANFTMYGGAIENNRSYADGGGGGVRVFAGNFTMHGGVIRNNESGVSGGGVSVRDTFIMHGGSIYRNESESFGGGGVRVGSNDFTSTFTMTGGEIRDNETVASGGGVHVNNGATFTMSEGTNGSVPRIVNNEASRTTSGTSGGGVWVGNQQSWINSNPGVPLSTFTMLGGEISGNSSRSGGGVYVYRGEFVMENNSVITDNDAFHGGGVHVNNGAIFTMSGGANGSIPRIVDNTGNTGGGVYVIGENSSFDMHDGEISENHGTGSGGSAGVAVRESAVFTMHNGRINHNVAVGPGGGVNVNYDATFVMNDGEIYLNSSNHSGVGGGLRIVEGKFIMHDGVIRNNEAPIGGGVSTRDRFYMHGGIIYDNTATDTGGGVSVSNTGGGDHLTMTSTFTMTGGVIGGATPAQGNTARNGGGVSVGNHATFNLDGGTISNNTANRNGGGVLVDHSTFVMGNEDGTRQPTISHNTALTLEPAGLGNAFDTRGGGGVAIGGENAEFTMYSGIIEHNHTAVSGGGVLACNASTFEMHNGAIRYNRAENNVAVTGLTGTAGGGVSITNGSSRSEESGATFIMHDGHIHHNTHYGPQLGGGGISIARYGHFEMHDGTIEFNVSETGHSGGIRFANAATGEIFSGTIQYNTAETDGGGIGIRDIAEVMVHDAIITNNHAGQDGGGIFTVDYDYSRILPAGAYSNLSIAPEVVFANNTAGNGAFLPPTNPEVTDIATPAAGNGPSVGVPGLATTPIQRHTLNNYDINFRYMSITKSADVTSATVGDRIEYTITVFNPHADLEEDFIVVDVLDLDLVEFLSNTLRINGRRVPLTDENVSFNETTGELRITLNPLMSGETEITFEVEVLASAGGQKIVNVAELEVPGDRTPVPPTPPADVGVYALIPTIEKAAHVTTAEVGDTIEYTITVNNPNAVDFEGEFVVVDVLDVDLVDFIAGSLEINGEVADYSFNSTTGELRVILDPLANGVTEITFEVTVRPEAAGETVVNVATLEVPSDSNVQQPGPTPGVEVEIAPEEEPMLPPMVTKTADVETAAVGDRIEYAIAIHNPNGVVMPGEFVVVDMIDIDSVEFLGNTLRVNGQRVLLTDENVSFNEATGELRVTLSPLQTGNTVITFEVRVREEAAGLQVSNVAHLEAPDEYDFDEEDLRSDEVIVEIDEAPEPTTSPTEPTTVPEPTTAPTEPTTVPEETTAPTDATEPTTSPEETQPATTDPSEPTTTATDPEETTSPTLSTDPETTTDPSEGETTPDSVLPPMLTKEANVGTAEVGDTITYRITVNNPNEEALAGDFVVVDMIDISLVEFVAGSVRVNGDLADYSFNSTTGELRVVLNPLAVGNTNVTFDVVVREEAAGQTVVNVAVLEVPEDGDFDFPAPQPTPEVPVEIEPETTVPGPTDPETTTPPTEPTNPGEVCEYIIYVIVDEEGNVTVTVLPLPESALDYEIVRDENGNIIVVLPPGWEDCELVVLLPGDDWDYGTGPDDDGNLVVVITPPTRPIATIPEEDCDDDNRDHGNNNGPSGTSPGNRLPQTGVATGSALLNGLGLIGTGLIVASKMLKKEE